MLLNDHAIRAGAAATLPLLGRTSCIALPAAMQHGAVSSLGCIGNRVYTGLGEDELYIVVPGEKVAVVAEVLNVITTANAGLEEYARSRHVSLSTA